MTCEEFEQMLLDSHPRVSGDGWILRASRVLLVEEHVSNCPACATRMAETRRMEDALDQLRVSTAYMDAPASVEKKLLDTFRENAARRHPAIRAGFAWKLAWVSIATIVLAVTSFLLYWNRRPVSKEETKKNSSEEVISPRLVPDISSAAAPAIDESRKPGTENPRTTPKRRFAEAHTRMTEPGRALGVVQPSDVLSLNGGGSIVRVTLPFSSLIAMGVPVRPDLSETQVTADVWMDPFGAVVGVRLVPPKASAD